jgi:hypothetical protein
MVLIMAPKPTTGNAGTCKWGQELGGAARPSETRVETTSLEWGLVTDVP